MSTISKWKPVTEPPELTKEPSNWRAESKPVLVYYKLKNINVAIAWQDCDIDNGELEGKIKWSSCDSEAWDITGNITHWRHLPEPPSE